MWKQFVALARGRRFEAAQTVVDRNAHTILRQQIRDAAAMLEQARMAVAVAVAQDEAEARRSAGLATRLDDLEGRALAALDAGREGLAREAAEAIARLEADLAASRTARDAFAGEIERLRRRLDDAQERLRALRRGQRLAQATEHVQRLRDAAPGDVAASLRDAEATLERLRERQRESDGMDRALAGTNGLDDPDALSCKLARAGCGAPPPFTADAVLARLSERRRQTPA